MAETLRFKASAYLQTLIGRELFRSPVFAIVELVKNAYDSGATKVEITILPQSAREPGEIEIRDNGQGMSLSGFEKTFMFAGYSERPKEAERTDTRIPTGEKGIGRFASDRLGTSLVVTTKRNSDSHALRVSIDWTAFKARSKEFNEIAVPYTYVSAAEVGAASSGTVLRITKLREQWGTRELTNVRRTLVQLLDPVEPPPDFDIVLTAPTAPHLSGPIRPEPIEGADISIRFQVLEGGRVRRQRSGTLFRKKREAPQTELAPETATLEGLSGKFLYFIDRPSRQQTHDLDAGVHLFRDGFRVEPFGRDNSDWLGVAEKRAKRAGHAHIVPSRLFGFVRISRRRHSGLRDTTSREALLDTADARALVTLLRRQLEFLEEGIRTEVSEPRWRESQARQAIELERERFHTLSIMSSGLAHELRQPLQAIRSEADNIRKRLSQLGVNDDDIDESQQSIDKEIDRIDENIRFIASISSGDIEGAADVDLAEIVRTQTTIFATRCAAQGISVVQRIPASQNAHVNSTSVAMVLANLLKNAQDALLDAGDERQKCITVTLGKAGNKHVLEVRDTGQGIPVDIQPKIFKKFASKKTGGMGVGLYNCHLILRSLGGDIRFKSREGVGTVFTVELLDQE